MKLLILSLLTFSLLLLPSQAHSQGKAIQIYVAVPANYTSNATPAQADSAVRTWLGQPTDAPCIGSQYTCTIEGWFRHELGQVFEYQVTTVPIHPYNQGTDACGSWFGSALIYGVVDDLKAAHYNLSGRSMILLMGGGGWAGHFAPTDPRPNGVGMVGDWEVMQQFNEPTSCIPDWNYPNRGFSHEFSGMMGEYVTAGYNEGGLFIGDVMSAHERADLLHYSGGWLRNP